MTPEPESGGRAVPRQASPSGQPDPAAELQTLATEVGQVPPLRPGEKATLLELLRPEPDSRVVARLLETHLQLVLDSAVARTGRGLSVGDLFQEGSVGLLAAIRAFAGASEPDFDGFVAAQVALAMEDALSAEERAIRQESLLLEAAAEYDRTEIELAGSLHREPTIEEIAARLGWSAERVSHVRTVVAEARRVHDEELLQYIDPELVDVADLVTGDDVARN